MKMKLFMKPVLIKLFLGPSDGPSVPIDTGPPPGRGYARRDSGIAPGIVGFVFIE